MAKKPTYKLTGANPLGSGKANPTVPATNVRGTTADFSGNPLVMSALNTFQQLKAPAAANPWDSFYKTYASSIQTPAQIAATARKTALADEAATAAAQTAASNKIISQYNQQADRAQGMAQALSQIQSEQGNQAAAGYNTAANTLTGLGTGLTGAVSDAYQSQVDKARAQIAAITGGLGTVSAPEAGDIRNASQYAGVTGPAGTLAADAFNARQLALNAAHAGQQNVDIIGQNYRAQANQQVGKAAEDMRALIAGRPKSIQDLVTSLTANRTAGIQNLGNVINQRATFAQGEQKRRDDLIQQQFKNQLDWNQYLTTKGYLTTNQAQTQSTIEMNEANITGVDKNGRPTFANAQDKRNFITNMNTQANTKSETAGYFVDYDPKTNSFSPRRDKQGRLVPTGGYILNPKDKTGQSVIPYSKPGKAGAAVAGTGGLSTKEWGDLVKDGQAKADELMGIGKEAEWQWQAPQYDDNDELVPGTGEWKSPPGTNPVDYNTLLRSLLGMNSSKKWQQVAVEKANSFFGPGQGGRPWGTGPEAKKYIVQAAKAAKRERVPYNRVLADLVKMGLNRKQAETGIKSIFGNVTTWTPGEGVSGGRQHKPTDAGPRGGGSGIVGTMPAPTEVRDRWDPKADPVDPTVTGLPPGVYKTKSGKYVHNSRYVEEP